MRVGGMHYVRFYYWQEFNLAIFYDSPNRQIKVLAKFSRYTVFLIGLVLGSLATCVMTTVVAGVKSWFARVDKTVASRP